MGEWPPQGDGKSLPGDPVRIEVLVAFQLVRSQGGDLLAGLGGAFFEGLPTSLAGLVTVGSKDQSARGDLGPPGVPDAEAAHPGGGAPGRQAGKGVEDPLLRRL